MASQAELNQKFNSLEGDKDPFISISIRNIAAAIVEQSARVQSGQKVLVWFDEPGIQLAKEIKLRCLVKGAQTQLFMRDLDKDARIIPTLDENGIKHYFDEEERLMTESDVVLLIRGSENPEVINNIPTNLQDIYYKRYWEAHSRRMTDDIKWTLFYWPTKYEAKKENLPYDEYFRTCMKACNQPWEAIGNTQEKLIRKLNKGEKLQLIADENNSNLNKRINITMSIKGMTFINECLGSNYPGSEVFSAPVLDSVNGQIYANGEYMYEGKLMKNIYFKIIDGVIIEAYAEEGNKGLQEILNRGEGGRKFGEVALGTNPGLTRRFFNDLLNEKVGGSFHMAIGNCYNIQSVNGMPVNVNNGNTPDKTLNHWDLTILMHKKPDNTGGGKVILDNEIIQEDGIFKDPELAILNPKFD